LLFVFDPTSFWQWRNMGQTIILTNGCSLRKLNPFAKHLAKIFNNDVADRRVR
jgi:hypothetical protein